ncbi:MAG: 1-deoxy-D-xylulose-5-phosphate synthase [bacterium]|nr:1-deoxy-D-xylulose-5-phosphate synthase [bacterium]
MILEKISLPSDLANLSLSELSALSLEIRERLIATTSMTGGHLASSLGVVELTIALHKVFSLPKDKLIWDVGHQSYSHKLLTGRLERFHTLRQLGGISGFPKKKESVYDAFDTGHASTSISAALGMALARDLQKEDHKVVAIIGDGAISGGMAFEALNYAGQLKLDLLVVLNSNEMSISRTVGAFSAYLNKLVTLPIYKRFRKDMKELISRLPLGKKTLKLSDKIEEAIKGMIVPSIIFEELGFKYLGPIDGHNLALLIRTLEAIKTEKQPILFHIVTKKGKGYKPAEENPEWFHGTSPFEIKTGKPKEDEKPTYSKVFGKAITEFAREDKRIVAITAAMKEGCGLVQFSREFPERFFDCGICEEHAVTMAGGMAISGLRPVVAVYSTFLQRSYDQILHDVCLQNAPVIFAIDRAGIVGEDGETHQGLFDIGYLATMPNMIITAPKDGNELVRLMKTAFSANAPFAIRYPKAYAQEPSTSTPPFNIGEGELLEEGKNGLIITCGSMVAESLKAVEILEKDDLSFSLINSRFIKPLDKDLILSNLKPIVITVEEHSRTSGLGSQVANLLADKDCRVFCLGLPERFIEHGSRQKLLEIYELTPEGIAESIRRLIADFVTLYPS